MKEYKLKFELVPDGCWGVNLRSALPKELWDKVRFDAYARAKGRCTVCGAPTRRLEAHERWSYDEKTMVQKLEDVTALCRACHEVVHISRTQLIGKGDDAMEHFIKVNACTQSDFHAALSAANDEHKRRGRLGEWTTDISWLVKKGFLPKR